MTFDAPDSPEAAYLARATKAHRRRFAQVLTPPDCAALMADWVAGARPATLLDPAFGTGVLARAVAALVPGVAVTGYEIDPQIAAAGRAAWGGEGALDLRVASFFTAPETRFEAVIANPPFLRPGAGTELRAQVGATAARIGRPLSGLTNVYQLFVFEALMRLAPGGRAAILLPAEWGNANSSAPLKDWLVSGGYLREIITYCAHRPVFGATLTTASVVLLEAPRGGAGARPIRARFVAAGAVPAAVAVREIAPERLAAAAKWAPLLGAAAPHSAALPPGFVALGALATTRRGIATGANGFFHLTEAEAARRGLRPSQCLPCIAKAGDAEGLVFTREKFKALEGAGRPTRFFAPRRPLSPAEAAYVAEGAALGLDQRFLTRNRHPWYAPERLYRAPIWATTFGRDQMRFILNAAEVWQLTAFHGIFPRIEGRAFARALVAALNAEPVQGLMRAQARIYARGLLKLEPRDLLEIPVPDLRAAGPAQIAALGRALGALEEGRRGAAARLAALVEETAASAARGGKDEAFSMG